MFEGDQEDCFSFGKWDTRTTYMMFRQIYEVPADKSGLTPVESSEVEHDKKVDSAKVMIVHHPPEII